VDFGAAEVAAVDVGAAVVGTADSGAVSTDGTDAGADAGDPEPSLEPHACWLSARLAQTVANAAARRRDIEGSFRIDDRPVPVESPMTDPFKPDARPTR
jgi:hypothetical protein